MKMSSELRKAIGNIVDYCSLKDQTGSTQIDAFVSQSSIVELTTDDLYTVLSWVDVGKGVQYEYGLRLNHMEGKPVVPLQETYVQGILAGKIKVGLSEELVRRPIGGWEGVDVESR